MPINRYIILFKLLRESERPRASVTRTYFKALGELRSEGREAHNRAIAGQADFAEVARIWLEIQFALAMLSAAWFLPRRFRWGLWIGQFAAFRIDSALLRAPAAQI